MRAASARTVVVLDPNGRSVPPGHRRRPPGWRGWYGPGRAGWPAHQHLPIDTCPHRSPLYMTTSTVEQTSTPQVAVNDIGSAEDFLAAIDETIKYFNDGDIVSGTIVKVDRDEVLLDIGYKTEGVIPSRELSIKHDVDPGEVV